MKETPVKPRNVADALRLVGQQQNWVDRAIAYVAPGSAVQRMKSRTQLAMAGAYTGASRSKRTLSSWKPGGGSADADLLPDLPALRERSRDLLRNAPLAGGAINTVCTNVVGTGLMLKSQVDRETLGWSEEKADEWQRATEREFALWAESTMCDATRTQDFYGLQDLALRSTLENGDVFSLLPMIPLAGCPYDLRVQLIEADRISNNGRAADTSRLAGGVELDDQGAPKQYWIANRHPGDIGAMATPVATLWTPYPAFGGRTGRRNVLHLYTKLRVGQTRGVPYLAPVVELLKQMTRYTESEVFAAVLTSMVAIIWKSDGEGPSPLESAVNGQTPGGAGDAVKSGWDGTLSPGLSVDLGLNESVESMASSRPNAAFDPFMQALLRQVGAQLELPFEVLVKHFTASYSAARAALLEAWKFYRRRRFWLAFVFCQPVYATWMEEAVARGRIAAPGFFRDPAMRAAYLGAVWAGDGPGAIDPGKEADAAVTRMGAQITTLDDEVAAYDGGRAKDKIERAGRERAMKDKAGLLSAPAPTPADPEVPPAPDAGDKETADQPEDEEAAADRKAQRALIAAKTSALLRAPVASVINVDARSTVNVPERNVTVEAHMPEVHNHVQVNPGDTVINNLPAQATRTVTKVVRDESGELSDCVAETRPLKD